MMTNDRPETGGRDDEIARILELARTSIQASDFTDFAGGLLPALATLEAHAGLATLSGEVETRAALIDGGYDSLAAIARAAALAVSLLNFMKSMRVLSRSKVITSIVMLVVAALAATGARMGRVVHLGQVLEVQVRVDLRRRYIGMAEEFLDAAQVVARLEDMGCEGVPEQVRVDVGVDALLLRPVLDARLHGARADTHAAIADKQSGFLDIGEIATPSPMPSCSNSPAGSTGTRNPMR